MRSIHSVTNTVQTLHVMYSDSSCECTMLPTPFLSLPSQKTEDVYGAYSAHLIVSNGSIGHRIQALENAVPNIGAKLQDLLDQVGWKLHVFVGDAAKTNSAIFKIQKRHQLAVGAKRKLSIQIKCLLHQICLVRRPSILAIDAYWSTVVRLAHLFENWSFKRQFGISLLHILRQPGIAVSEFPDEMSNWKLRADWLVKGFFPTAKGAIDLLKSLLQLLNGNSMEPVFTHWCLPGCCGSQQESLQKVAEVAIPLFSRGFQCPLLYRFKHYTVASSYLRTACCCFDLLPQVLTQLNAVASEQDSKLVDGLLQDSGVPVENTELGDLLDNDLSFSLQNSVRRRKVVEQVTKTEFPQSVIMVDVIVNALEYGSNALFKRTSLLTRMSTLGSHHPEYATLANECMERFLDITSGSFGKRLIERTVVLLDVEVKHGNMQWCVAKRASSYVKSLSSDDKAPWNIQARHEQMCREELVDTPLPVKGSTATTVHVERWLYTPLIDDTKALRVNADHVLTSFTIDIASSKSVSRKRPIKLPFGLKEIRKPRKRKVKEVAGAKYQNEAKERKRERQDGVQDPTDNLPCEHSSSMFDANSNSESGSDSDSGSSRGDHCEIEDSGDMAPFLEEDNEVEPISEIMENEMKAEWQVAQEIQEADKNKAKLAKYVEAEGTAEPKSRSKTFFSQRLGLGFGSVAPT
ncbi:unnamed protein product, partial [Durusdinium trenchii]